jgi:hypothetical protein
LSGVLLLAEGCLFFFNSLKRLQRKTPFIVNQNMQAAKTKFILFDERFDGRFFVLQKKYFLEEEIQG